MLHHPARRSVLVVLVLLLSATLFAACGGGNDDSEESGDFDVNSMVPAAQPTPAAGAAAADAEQAAGLPPAEGGVSNLIAQTNPIDRHVIRQAQLTLKVGDVEQALVWVRDLAGQRSGFVFGSTSYIEEGYEYAQITIRVPSDQFDGVMAALRGAPFVVNVEREESSSEDVSAEYVDNESRLKALEATELRLLELLTQAEDIDEILRVEYELNNVRAQIETIKGRQQYLDEMTAFSTISVYLQPDAPGAQPDEDSDNLIARVLDSTWNNAEDFLEGLLVFTLTAGIVVLALSPFGVLAWFVYRLVRRRMSRPVSGPQIEPTVAGS